MVAGISGMLGFLDLSYSLLIQMDTVLKGNVDGILFSFCPGEPHIIVYRLAIITIHCRHSIQISLFLECVQMEYILGSFIRV